MKKVLIGSAIALFIVFTAGLATAGAHTPTSIFPFVTSTGTLHFVNNSGVASSDSAALITIDQATPLTDGPTNIFYGTLTLASSATDTVPGPVLTIKFAATPGPMGNYHIYGTDAAGDILSATGNIANRFESTSFKHDQSIELTGSIIVGPGTATAVTYRLEGVLYK